MLFCCGSLSTPFWTLNEYSTFASQFPDKHCISKSYFIIVIHTCHIKCDAANVLKIIVNKEIVVTILSVGKIMTAQLADNQLVCWRYSIP